MASYVINRGVVYWTDREQKILQDNIHKSVDELLDLLPSRTRSAIYQRRNQVRKKQQKTFESNATIQRVYKVTKDQSAKSIMFEVHGINITINF